jgi:hypothetical protein
MATNMAPTPRHMMSGTIRDYDHMSAVQKAAVVVSAAFLLVGIAGFIPGITSNFDEIEFAGHESGAELFGLFQTSILHNLVHLAFGVIGLAMVRTAERAKTFLFAGGVLYLLLWAYGLIVDNTSDANFAPFNTADDWLHFALGAGMVALSGLGRRSDHNTM